MEDPRGESVVPGGAVGGEVHVLPGGIRGKSVFAMAGARGSRHRSADEMGRRDVEGGTKRRGKERKKEQRDLINP